MDDYFVQIFEFERIQKYLKTASDFNDNIFKRNPFTSSSKILKHNLLLNELQILLDEDNGVICSSLLIRFLELNKNHKYLDFYYETEEIQEAVDDYLSLLSLLEKSKDILENINAFEQYLYSTQLDKIWNSRSRKLVQEALILLRLSLLTPLSEKYHNIIEEYYESEVNHESWQIQLTIAIDKINQCE